MSVVSVLKLTSSIFGINASLWFNGYYIKTSILPRNAVKSVVLRLCVCVCNFKGLFEGCVLDMVLRLVLDLGLG